MGLQTWNTVISIKLYVLLRERAHSCPRLRPSVESKVVLVTSVVMMMVLTVVEYVESES